MTTIDKFEGWLIGKGHPVKTPSGLKSTTPDYIGRVKKVAKEESLSIEELAQNIDVILPQYLPGGSKEDEGYKSHKAVSSALQKFRDFIRECSVKQ